MSSPHSTPQPAELLVPIGAGELIDKLTILAIKSDRISDLAKLANVRHEEAVLRAVAERGLPRSERLDELTAELKTINEQLWEIEDRIRVLEAESNFGEEFVQVARSVYLTNDRRSEIKRAINKLCGSGLIEEKSFSTD